MADDDPVASRAPLTRDRIVLEAIALVDEMGLTAMTMRGLGERLGVEAMSIYHHVNGREDLLEAVVDRVVASCRVPPTDPIGPVDGWQGYLHRLATSVRAIATDHPQVFPLVATRHPAAPWLRPPLRSLAVVEDFLVAMGTRGLSPEQAVHVYKAFTSFLLGHLLLEVATTGASTGPVEEPLDEGDADTPTQDQAVSLADFPAVAGHQALLSRHEPDAEFEGALEALLDRLDLELSQ